MYLFIIFCLYIFESFLQPLQVSQRLQIKNMYLYLFSEHRLCTRMIFRM